MLWKCVCVCVDVCGRVCVVWVWVWLVCGWVYFPSCHISSSPHFFSYIPPSPSVFLTQLEIEHFIPTLLYFGYTSIMVFGFWLLTGSIGFYATYFFIRKIYSAVKQD